MASIGPFYDFIGGLFSFSFFIAIIIAIIVIIVKLYNYVKPEIQAQKESEEYQSELSDKYDGLNRNEKTDVYNKLIDYCKLKENSHNNFEKSRNARGETEYNLLLNTMGEDILADDCLKEIYKKYGISINKKYIEYDINYLDSVT